MKEFYVYALCSLEDLEKPLFFNYDKERVLYLKPFYIGKGKNGRANDHRKEAKKYSYKDLSKRTFKGNKHKLYTIKKLCGTYCPIMVAENLEEEEAYSIEKEVIQKIGLENLTNLRGGGREGSFSEEHKINFKKSLKEKNFCVGQKNPMYGKNYQCYTTGGIVDHSSSIKKGKAFEDWMGKEKAEQCKKKMSESRTGGKNGRAIKIICLETGEVFSTITEAHKIYGPGDYHRVIMKKQKTCSGLHWEKFIDGEDYSESNRKEKIEFIDNSDLPKTRGCKKVKCIETNTVYPSMKKASEDTGVPKQSISASCRYGCRAKGQHWVYYD